MTCFLEINKLTKIFSGRGVHTAVDSIDLEIKEGELLTLLGPSGCGKTTVLRMIAGLEVPTNGKIILGGVNVTDVPPNKRNVAMVFQHYALFPHLSVGDNLAFGLLLRRFTKKEIREKVINVLNRIGLDNLGRRMPNELSGGQQQRVALARALIIEPKVLLCDEPLSNLDAALRIQMRHEIRKIHREFGITTIYVTHDHEEAMALSDRIVLMKAGKIEQIGTPADFYRIPKSGFVREFFGNAKLISGNIDDGHFSVNESNIKLPIDVREFKKGKASLVLRPGELTIIED